MKHLPQGGVIGSSSGHHAGQARIACVEVRAPRGERETISGVAQMLYADTFEVAGERVRLIGIDAPEGAQMCHADGHDWPCGQVATAEVYAMVGADPVTCEVYGRYRRGRALAECFQEGWSLNAAIVQAGWALAWNPSTGAVLGPRYDEAEAEAAAAGAGMWRGEFVEPWVWRQHQVLLSGSAERSIREGKPMKWSFSSIVIIAILALDIKVAVAEPGPVTQWLMNTPASMWTMGMANIKNRLDHANEPLASQMKWVLYDWEKNRIFVDVYSSEPLNQDRCGYFLDWLRKLGGVHGGKLMVHRANSLFASDFSRDYSTRDEPLNYLAKIDDIIMVRVLSDAVSCEGRLISSELLFRQ